MRSTESDFNERNFELRIKDVGPLKDFNATFNHLSILLGRPNSGKSYVLRSLYLYLQALDNYSDKILEQDMLNNDSEWHVIKSVSLDDTSLVTIKDYVVKALRSMLDSYSDRNITTNSKRKGSISKSEIKNALVTDFSLQSIGQIEESINVEFSLNKKLLTNDYTEIFKKMMLGSLNSRTLENITLNGRNIVSLIEESVKNTIHKEGEKFSVKIPDYLPLILPASSNTRDFFPLRRILRELQFDVTVNCLLVSVSESKIDMDLKIVIKLDKKSLSGRFIELIDIRPDYIKTIRAYLEQMETFDVTDEPDFTKFYRSVMLPILDSVSAELDKDLFLKTQTEFKTALRALSGINSVKFIPYGRSALIQLSNLVGNEDITDYTEELQSELNSYKGIAFASYLEWLGKGKQKLKANEDVLQELFSPIMGGRISLINDDETLGYQYQKDRILDLNLSSAMVEEMTGLLLPLLTSNDNELVLLEEPEAQLHVSIQILMGILLIALVKRRKLKIAFTTHSDLIPLVIHYILDLKPSVESLTNLMSELIPGLVADDKYVKRLAEAVCDDENSIVSDAFYLDRDSKSRIVNRDELEKSVPGISKTINTFAKWTATELQRSVEAKSKGSS